MKAANPRLGMPMPGTCPPLSKVKRSRLHRPHFNSHERELLFKKPGAFIFPALFPALAFLQYLPALHTFKHQLSPQSDHKI
jgi:hypothetical protein